MDSSNIIDLDARWGQVVSSIPRNGRGVHWIGGWMDRRAVLEAMEKKKSLASLRNRNPIRSPLLYGLIHRALIE
jgi:hypothetical protein